jgi:RNA polymerase sigma-B factor
MTLSQVKSITLITPDQAVRDLVIGYLPVIDRLATRTAIRSRFIEYTDDLKQVAREALVKAAVRLVDRGITQSPDNFLLLTAAGAMKHFIRDRVRIVRLPRQQHEAGTTSFGHTSLDQPLPNGGGTLLNTVESPGGSPLDAAMRQELLDAIATLADGEADAIRLTFLAGYSLREAGERMGVSRMTVLRLQEAGLAKLRQVFAGQQWS